MATVYETIIVESIEEFEFLGCYHNVCVCSDRHLAEATFIAFFGMYKKRSRDLMSTYTHGIARAHVPKVLLAVKQRIIAADEQMKKIQKQTSD